MINDEQRTSHFYNKLAGTENDLDHVLSTYVDSEHEITNFCRSQYVDISEIHAIFQNVQIQLWTTRYWYLNHWRQPREATVVKIDKFLPARAS